MPDMRFAPAPVLLEQRGSGGLNQISVRGHNERLILDLIRREGSMSRLEMGRRTGLSAQTVSVLVRALLKEGLLLEGEISKGRVGPPTTPFTLNPDGAFAVGIYAGVRVIDACVLDFTGRMRQTKRRHIDTEKELGEQVTAIASDLLENMSVSSRNRCLGAGLGVNQAHWSKDRENGSDGWHPDTGLESVEDRLTNRTELPCYIYDDTTCAATGQVLYGGEANQSGFLYCHVGARTQGRVVLGGQAQVGQNEELLSLPGLMQLEQDLLKVDYDVASMWMGKELGPGASDAFKAWREDLASQLTLVSKPLLAFLNLSQLVIVTSLAPSDTEHLKKTVTLAIEADQLEIDVIMGHNTAWAKASGAAACVLSERFTPG